MSNPSGSEEDESLLPKGVSDPIPNNVTKKKDKGPKYHRWNATAKKYEVRKPYQLDHSKTNDKIRIVPVGLKTILIEQNKWHDYLDYFKKNNLEYLELDDTNNTPNSSGSRVSSEEATSNVSPLPKITVNVTRKKKYDKVRVPVQIKENNAPIPEIVDIPVTILPSKAFVSEELEPETEDIPGIQVLYPTLDDPEFNIKIAERKEFYDTRYDGTIVDVKLQSDKSCTAEFELLPHQLFVKNFLSMQTPYTSLLLYHSLGSGKTCTSIGIAEEMRSYMKQIGMNRRILVLASPNVINNFRLQLFDESKLRLENGIWNIRSCVGNAILNELNPTHLKDLNKTRLIANVHAIIKTYYDFQGYVKFSNEVANALEPYPEGDSRRIRKIQSMFNDRLIIIDEVHNIRLTRDNDDLTTANYLYRIAKHAKNLRFVLLSATPMYNSYKEIIWLTNLMNANDKRPEVTVEQIFTKTGEFRVSKDEDQIVGEELLRRKLTGYVSYVRGENPYTFPYRIYCSNLPEQKSQQYPPIYLTKISGRQERVYRAILEHIYPSSSETTTNQGDILEKLETLDNIGYEQLRTPIQALNIVYQDISKDSTNTNFEQYVGKPGLHSIMEPMKDGRFRYRTDSIPIFKKEHLHKYSQKMSSILQLIEGSTGIVMIYSEFIDAGVIPMAMALEESGYTRFPGIKHKNNSLIFDINDKSSKKYGSYAMITGNKTYSPSNQEELSVLTSRENSNGEKIRIVLISRAGAEGLDFKNIRQIHILEPWYNMSRIEQIIGRGVRNLSHCQLPFEERNVEIYMHATQTESGAPTADTYLYEIAFKKAKQIGRVSRLIKESSVDCILNRDQNNFTLENMNQVIRIHTSHGEMEYQVGDRPNTAICDYMDSCSFKCRPDIPETDPRLGENLYTYSMDYTNTNRTRIVEIIRQLFIKQIYYHIDDLVLAIQNQRKYPIEQIYYSLTYLIENRNEYLVDRIGRLGNLVNRGEIYAFQPVEISDESITVFDRTFPVEYKIPKIRLQLSSEFTPDIVEPVTTNIVSENPKMNTTTKSIADQYKQYVDTIQHQIEEITEFETKKTSLSQQQWSDYLHVGGMLSRLNDIFHMDSSTVIKYMIHHAVDSLPTSAKFILATGTITIKPTTDIESRIQEYIRQRIYRVKGVMRTVSDGMDYLIIPNEQNIVSIFKRVNDEWIISEYTDIENAKQHVIDPIRSQFEPFKDHLSLLVGFMVTEHTNEKNSPMIFKVKDYTKMTKSGNAKGENMKKAGKKRAIEILEIAFRNLHIHNDSKIKEQNFASNEYSQGGLCLLLELLLRNSRQLTKQKIMYLSPEEAIIVRITTEKR
uniref:Nucleoside triphosphatase I n=1 Tax=viral metagenome TaxID=1070528 RepID=A0A6C0IDM2_9ZZZZ